MCPFILGKFQGFEGERVGLAINGVTRGAWDDGQSWTKGKEGFHPSVILVAVWNKAFSHRIGAVNERWERGEDS